MTHETINEEDSSLFFFLFFFGWLDMNTKITGHLYTMELKFYNLNGDSSHRGIRKPFTLSFHLYLHLKEASYSDKVSAN
jgi:hypothetical protein